MTAVTLSPSLFSHELVLPFVSRQSLSAVYGLHHASGVTEPTAALLLLPRGFDPSSSLHNCTVPLAWPQLPGHSHRQDRDVQTAPLPESGAK